MEPRSNLESADSPPSAPRPASGTAAPSAPQRAAAGPGPTWRPGATEAEKAARIAEAMSTLRATMHDLQSQQAEVREERRRVEQRLREAEAAAAAAEEARARAAELEERLRGAEAALAAAREEAGRAPARDSSGDAKELAAAARIVELEAALASARHDRLELLANLHAPAPAARPVPAPAAHAADADADAGFPTIPGVRIERAVGAGPGGMRLHGREISSRRPVDVYLLPAVVDLLDGKRLDSVLLARHPALVSALAFAVCEQGPYLVTERSEGETVAAWATRVGRVPERVALSVALEVARGLRHAATLGSSHGDLSPESILIEATGNVRVQGVGLRAVFARPHEAPTAPEYSAPERLRGDVQSDVRSDLYSLGAILHRVLTGGPPYPGDADAVARQQSASRPPDVRSARPDVSERTAKLVAKLLAPDPENRFQTWDQLLLELERSAAGPASSGADGEIAPGRRLTPWIAALGVCAILATAFAWWWRVGHDESAAERFRVACADAERMQAAGDTSGALAVYRAFLAGTGDEDVEIEAARRFDLLNR